MRLQSICACVQSHVSSSQSCLEICLTVCFVLSPGAVLKFKFFTVDPVGQSGNISFSL